MNQPADRVSRIPISVAQNTGSSDLLDSLREHSSRELVFAVIGYAGSGTSAVGIKLRAILEGLERTVHTIKAREVLDNFALATSRQLPSEATSPIDKISAYQNIGDALRNESGEYGSVAAYMVRRIREIRDQSENSDNIFILDSLKHPAEIRLLRHVYGDNFCLIGVGCRPDIRKTRLERKLGISSSNQPSVVDELIDRDAEDSDHKYGQQVNDTFHLADYFVDNTASDEDPPNYTLPDKLKRLLGILCDGKIHRPERDERGLYYAHAAALRSSCLSRQVGAAIMDGQGNLLSIGTNDVPRFGGGLYSDLDDEADDRCFKSRKECSNTVKQIETVREMYDRLLDEGTELLKPETTFDSFLAALKPTRVRSLIEFSRSIHAEMDALFSLVRNGIKLTENSTLYSTTYPCHNCARHIVAAGIQRVVYLEPYSKSLAIDLHNDSIADNLSDAESENMVRFRPYQGVSPRLFKLIYTKTGEFKDSEGKLLPPSGLKRDRTGLWTKSYQEFEDEIIDFITATIETRDESHEENP